MLNNFTLFVPTKFYYQLPVDPILCFGKNVKAIDRLYASFIHGLIAPETDH